MESDNVVVAGIGLTTPLGCGREISWEKIKSGKSLVSEPVSPDLPKELSQIVRFSPYINPNGLHRIFFLALEGVKEALSDSEINLDNIPSGRIGCSVSVSKPIFHQIKDRSCPLSILLPDSVNQYLTRELQISGPTQNVIAACSTGIHSLLIASRWLKENKCDVVIAGSVESSLHPLYISGFQKMGVLSDFPCPFDKRRDGFTMGEGAGILILERKSDVHARKGKIYAELVNCSIGSDCNQPAAFDSNGDSIAKVLNKAIKDSNIKIEDVDYINMHGTGTQMNDLIETRAIKKVFGKHSPKISLSSTKASTGHLLGASGSVESAIACLTIRDQYVSPTIHLENRDPECDLDYTANHGRKKKVDIAASLSFGFGGHIGVVIFRKLS